MKKKFRGRHKFICDVDGMTYYSEDKRIRWDGAVVHKNNLESRHPQELIKSVKEDTSIKEARPELGEGSDQAGDYVFSAASQYPTFALATGDGRYITTNSTEYIQIPPVGAVLS